MTRDDPRLHVEVDPAIGAWLRTLPEPPPTLVGDVVRRLPTTPQRRPRRWRLERMLHVSALARPTLAVVRSTSVIALVIGAFLVGRATWPMSRVEQLAGQYGLVLAQAVDPSVVQVLRDDAGHDLTATWPDHPRDIDRIATGPDGEVWVAQSARDSDNEQLIGAQVWRMGEPGVWGHEQGVPLGIADMAVGPDGMVWLADGGVTTSTGTTWIPTGPPDGNVRIGRLEPAPDGSVWGFGGLEGAAPGVWQLAAGQWRDRSEDAVLGPAAAANAVRAVATTQDGTTWIGLFAGGGGGAGLLRSVGDGWQLVRPLGDLGEDASHDVFALSAGPDGSLWAFLDSPFYGTGTDFRLARWDGTTWTSWADGDGLPDDATPWSRSSTIMRVGRDGTAWFIGDRGGLVAFDGRDARRYLTGRFVNDFAIAPDGTVWVAADRSPDGGGGIYAILP